MRFGGTNVQRGVPCTMRDGVTLYSDIYMPVQEGTYPVLLMRQPYGRMIASTVSHAHPVWYASRGYIVVIQDVRGRGDSEGTFRPFIQEAADGYDAVEWAAALPGSNGKVGMYGFSYQGLTQWAAASEAPPSLKAIAPSMCPADLYHGSFYPFGSFSIGDKLPWAFQLARDTAMRAGDHDAVRLCSEMMRHPEDQLFRVPVLDKHPVLERYFPEYYEWCEHTEYDEYWQDRNWLTKFMEHPVPTLHIGGWYDSYLMGTLRSYEALQSAPAAEGVFHRLIVGPWTHIPWGQKAGGVDHGPHADGNIHEEQVRWFDYWLKGDRFADQAAEPAVKYFEQYSKEWRTADVFPGEQEPGRQRLYLSGSAKPASGALGGGALKLSPEAEEGVPDVFVYDARLPMRLDSYLPADRSAQQDRYEILVYTSEALTEPLHLLGTPKAAIRYETMEGPTDLVAALTALLPDGTARFLSIGRTDIGVDGAEGEDVQRTATIRLRPCGAALMPGTRIRLELTGSAFPLFVRHPNGRAGEKHTSGEERLRIAAVAIGSGGSQPSVLELPII
ncbi:CocE/NonD family hydrolase [Paenibacillus protaetiae]|uniref:CocE/NonD family hydrolase n=1 Tax=Paenibacillus protaetiae TaxID=2509456 RepID=A0A4P6F0E4_9BACL|nr:CocE/NonD family hydrolase [Paenibacillus protaetiae]QAY66457.1 CocE/NonD family hydrolase [Paenibacillus protaetiae]